MDRQPTILLVEDEHVLRTLVAAFLRQAGYLVSEAADGAAAIVAFRSRGPFDAVLLDLNLPDCSGVDVCRSVRDQEPDQPVIVASAAILPEHHNQLEGMGISGYLTKPYHPERLLERLQGLRMPAAVAV
jgi:DNA-binding response OmpR family regulator